MSGLRKEILQNTVKELNKMLGSHRENLSSLEVRYQETVTDLRSTRRNLVQTQERLTEMKEELSQLGPQNKSNKWQIEGLESSIQIHELALQYSETMVGVLQERQENIHNEGTALEGVMKELNFILALKTEEVESLSINEKTDHLYEIKEALKHQREGVQEEIESNPDPDLKASP